jgi:hypothetical protein
MKYEIGDRVCVAHIGLKITATIVKISHYTTIVQNPICGIFEVFNEQILSVKKINQ